MSLLSKTLATVAQSKALGDHPVFHDFTTPTTHYTPGAARTDAMISQREAAVHGSVYGGRYAVDWAMDCVRLYADTTSSATWHLERDGKVLVQSKEPNTPKDYQVGPKDLYELLDRPNPFMDYSELIDLLVIDLLLVGNAYWYKHAVGDDGKPLSLFRMSPAHVKIKPGPNGPKGYEYQPPGARSPMKFALDSVCHFRLPNPHSPYYGLGIVQGGGRVFDTEIALTETQASYYENNADPSVIFQSDRRVPRDVFNKLRAQLRAKVSGPSNSGEMLLLENGLKASTLSPSARDALFEEITKLSRDRIFAMFRCAPMLFGIMDESSGSTKISDFRREFDTKTMRPFLDRLQKRITRALLEPWDVDFVFDYNYTIPQEEIIKQAGELAAIPGITPREIRRFLAPIGVEESTGDAEIDDMVLNLPGEEMDEDGQGGLADRNLPGEAGRPPKGENTSKFPRRAAVRKPAAKDVWSVINERMARAEVKAVALRAEQPWKMPAERRPPDQLADDRTAAINYVVNSTVPKINDAVHVLERALMDHTEGTKALTREAERRMRNSSAWSVFGGMLEDALVASTEAAASTALTHQGALGRQATIDVEELAQDIVRRPEGLDSIVANLKTETLKIVGDAIEAGKEREEVDLLIRQKIDTWRRSHSETVALTEVTHAYNETTLAVAEAVGGKVLVEDGHDHDAECAEADGQVWDIEQARSNRLEHPRCRRAFTILDEE